MSLKVYINGQLYDKEKAMVSVFDHGLLYGDGVFEGIRAYHGKVFKLEAHIERLFSSAKAIMLEIPMTRQQVAEAIVNTLKVNGLSDAYIRVVVTRGVGTLGLDPRKCSHPQVIIITDAIALYPEEYYEKGLDIITGATRRTDPSALNPRIKSLNYLNNILARIEGTNAGVMEVLMLNSQGFVAECTGDNIFTVKNGDLYTPPVSAGILIGVTRMVVIEIATKAGYKVYEPNMTLYDIHNADECFLTGTAAEIIPVVKLDGRHIGDGKPGPVTKELLRLFRQYIQSS